MPAVYLMAANEQWAEHGKQYERIVRRDAGERPAISTIYFITLPDISDRRYRLNHQIRIPLVMVIDENGKPLGQMDTAQALTLAQSRGLDLVEVAPQARPPVCRILNFNAFLFQQEKQLRKAKANQKKVDLKGIRLTFRIGQHDLDTRKRTALEFLDEGHKVLIEMRLRGRENALADHGRKVIDEFVKSLGDDISTEQPLGRLGNRFTMIVGRKK